MKKCPFCAEEIQDEAVFCRYCRHDLQTIGDGSSSIHTPPPIAVDLPPKQATSVASVALKWGIILAMAGSIARFFALYNQYPPGLAQADAFGSIFQYVCLNTFPINFVGWFIIVFIVVWVVRKVRGQ